jgi:hypothetical protein
MSGARQRSATHEYTATLTFAECVENHVGHQQIGTKVDRGPSVQDLHLTREAIAVWFAERSLAIPEMEIVDLGALYPEARKEAAVLVIRDLRAHSAKGAEELLALDWDKSVWNKYTKSVGPKHARWNLCFTDVEQEPDYEAKKGRILRFDKCPEFMSRLRRLFSECLHVDGVRYSGPPLYTEGNYYYDRDAYIGWHGDTERKIVAGYRVGYARPLHFWWFERPACPAYRNGLPVGHTFDLRDGDGYIMSEEAVGGDFMRATPHLRHAAGSMDVIRKTQKYSPF